MGLEPTTFKLEVQRAYPLRHEGTALAQSSKRTCLLEKFYCILK